MKESTATFESTRKCVFVSSNIFYPHKERINNFPWKLESEEPYTKNPVHWSISLKIFFVISDEMLDQLWKGGLSNVWKCVVVICNKAFYLHTFKWIDLVLYKRNSINSWYIWFWWMLLDRYCPTFFSWVTILSYSHVPFCFIQKTKLIVDELTMQSVCIWQI